MARGETTTERSRDGARAAEPERGGDAGHAGGGGRGGLRKALRGMDYAAGVRALAPPDGDGGGEGHLKRGQVRAAIHFNAARFRRHPGRWRAIEAALGVPGPDAAPDAVAVEAVAAFQASAGVEVDGKVGVRSTRALVAAHPGLFEGAKSEAAPGSSSGGAAPGAAPRSEAEAEAREAASPAGEAPAPRVEAPSGEAATSEVDGVAAAAAAAGARSGGAQRRAPFVGMKNEAFDALPTHDAQGELTARGIAEAARALRGGAKPWNPAWLVLAQKAVGAPTDGGFSRDFVLKVAALQRTLGAKRPSGVLDAKTIAALGQRDPMLARTPVHLDGEDPGAMEEAQGRRKMWKPASTILEAAVVAVGAAKDWADWNGQLKRGSFLGIPVNGHYRMLQRLVAAERYLQLKDPKATPREIGQKVGCHTINSTLRAISATGIGMHQWGLAFDIDVPDNPWILGQKDKGNEINNRAPDVIARATAFMQRGERIAGKRARSHSGRTRKLARMGHQLTTDELADRVIDTNAALDAYRKLAKDPAGIERQFAEATGAVRKRGLAYWLRQIPVDDHALVGRKGNWDHANAGKSGSKGFMSFKKELIIALRDVAGLAWGGCDLGPSNGDMMHWDMRKTPFGGKIRKKGEHYKYSVGVQRQLARMKRTKRSGARR